ncbi:MAG: hypothetical protein ACO3S8_04065 [Aquiluna sp.]
MRALTHTFAGLAMLAMLSGCSADQVIRSGADAAACTALEGTLESVAQAYKDGVVDSGVLDRVDELIGDQVEVLLSSDFADEVRELGDALAESDSAQGAQQRVDDALSAISARCNSVGVKLD